MHAELLPVKPWLRRNRHMQIAFQSQPLSDLSLWDCHSEPTDTLGNTNEEDNILAYLP